ncbi:REP-associated tyrosine transposase [Dryocola sp. BD586]|uniref:REP-associated tyrosine transposase n=1 Tax=Dryocola sp. BD586 TaxID=3133271 RepID=UPI003F502860
MPNYRRSYVPGGTWFFTVNLFHRHSDLLTRHLAELRQAIQKVKLRSPFRINAWVVLPDHMHCIWTLPAGDSDYSARWREIKKSFTKSLHYAARPVWQKRFWEHCIRDEQDYAAHMNYLYINPLKHGLVDKVSDWPFSSFHRDVKRGIYPADWAGVSEELNTGERR